MTPVSNYTTQDLGHLGLVAGMCQELEIAKSIDQFLPSTEKQISHGIAVSAMILNGLGFTNQRLYLVPQFFKNKPVDRLLGKGITYEQLNDDTLGRTLDAIYAADTTQIYANIAAKSCYILGLKSKFVHLDSSSFHADGKYNADDPDKEGVIKITKGYSRDHRPELNQCILDLIVESQASIPIHMNTTSGNIDDKTGFRDLIQSHIDNLQNVHNFKYLVADSALYVEETLKNFPELVLFISRVPANISIVKYILENIDTNMMQDIDDNYSYQEVCGVYGGIKQRWVTVYSQHAYERDIKILNRRALKFSEQEQKNFAKLCRQSFTCYADAQQAWEKFKKNLKYTSVYDVVVREQPRYTRRGKPKKGEQPKYMEYFLVGNMASCLQKRAKMIHGMGMFVLATNELDDKQLSALEVLKIYKGQAHVEKGFRFLKHPEFLASALFLKKPERIMALMMIMTLCLMVYAALEYRIRQGLQQKGKTVADQRGKNTNTPTARWIFHCFVGIHVLFQNKQYVGILNLDNRHWDIIDLLGYHAYYS